VRIEEIVPSMAALVGRSGDGRGRDAVHRGEPRREGGRKSAMLFIVENSFKLADLPDTAADVAAHLTAAGFTEEAHLRQTLALAEEVGEFVGAVRRYYRMARRAGTFDDVEAELADVVLTAFVTAHTMGIDLEKALAAKLAVIYTRGWREQ
jgi:NTP pyrophosphatase (non-canonical NTP hydrolase)